MSKPRYLLRTWGRDVDAVTALRPPDLREAGGVCCYWFNTPAERDAFQATWPANCCAMRDRSDPGEDDDGHPIDTRAMTVAVVTLRLPDGRVGMFEMEFGYGYPRSSVHYMWREGNYSCDCNKRLYLARECGIDPQYDDGDMENPCGDTIALVSLDVFTRPLSLVTQ